jgi:hypothetical protein
MPVFVEIPSVLSMIGLLIGILVCLEFGRRLGMRHLKKKETEGKGPPVEAALFGLLGLLIAFTFSGASARFDARRNLIVDEANRIETGYMRIELMPDHSKPALKEKFREYLDSRIAIYRKVPDMEAVGAELIRNKQIQNELWAMTIVATNESQRMPLASLLLQSVNQMVEITTTRTMAAQMHPPRVIFGMLGLLILAVSLLAGFATAQVKSRSWLHIGVFAVIFALTIYVILDMEYPRLGLIRVDGFDQALVDVRERMD